jgi:hypothetical protein
MPQGMSVIAESSPFCGDSEDSLYEISLLTKELPIGSSKKICNQIELMRIQTNCMDYSRKPKRERGSR